MRSIQLRPTGRTNESGVAGEGLIVRDGQEYEVCSVRPGTSLSILDHNGQLRMNAPGDVNDANSGFQIAIDTLTFIKKQTTDQVFYEQNIPDFVPLEVGDGAWSDNILTNLTFSNADDFESGNVRSGESNSRLAMADSSIASKSIDVIYWAKLIGYNLIDVNKALMANNWDLIESKHSARVKNWQLGLQLISMLGSQSAPSQVPGLLTQANANTNTGFITSPISGMDAAAFQAFVAGLIQLYFANTNSTRLPNRFVIPMSDWLGLAAAASSTFPVIDKITYLENAFKKICGADFRVVPTAYADATTNDSLRGINQQIYALYRYDRESIRMDIPVDYTTTQPNSLNNFQFQDVGYGGYTGVGLYRNLELLYFKYTPSS